MATLLRQSTAVDIGIGPFVDSTDGVTAETALTISQADVRLKKNNGAWAQVNDNTSATHEENGWYEKELDATDTNTLGELIVAVAEAGALPVWRVFQVVPANVYDSLVLGSDTLDTQVTGIGAAVITAASIAADAITDAKVAADVTIASVTGAVGSVTGNVGGNVTGSVGSVAAGGITAASIAADAITAAKIADGAIDAATFAAGAITASAVAADAIGASELAADAVAEIAAAVAAGAVASVTGNVGGNVAGSVGSVTGNVGGNVVGSVGSLAAQAKADVNAEVLDVINVDAFAEPGQAAPAANASLATKISYLFKAWRNRSTQTSTTYSLYNDDAATVDQKATVADDGATFSRTEITSGP